MGFLDWFTPKPAGASSSAKREIDYEAVLTRFQEVALEYLNTCKYALMENKKAKVQTLSENFYRAYVGFTDNKDAFQKKGGRLRMAYLLIVKSIGPVYENVNLYVNGNTNDTKKAVRAIAEAISAIADIKPEDVAAAAK